MSDFWAYSGMPGPGAVSLTNERNALLGPITWYLLKGVVINGAATSDAGNTPTTELRHGLLMGIRASDGYVAHYSPNASDGTQVVAGFLWEPRRTVDTDGNTVNRPAQIVVAGYVKASQLLLLDEQARRQMFGRFIFDDRLAGLSGGFSQCVAKTANYTVVAGGLATPGDNNTHFTTTGATGEVDFTLPAPAKGNRFKFTNTVGQTMKIIGAANLVIFNSATATTLSFQMPGQLIGASLEIVADETGAKWIVHVLSLNALTIS